MYEFKNIKTDEIFIGTKREISTKYNLKYSNVVDIIVGRNKTCKDWVYLQAPTRGVNYNGKKTNGGLDKRYDHTTHLFKNIKTGEVVEMLSRDFSKKYNLQVSNVYAIVNRRRTIVGDWCLAD